MNQAIAGIGLVIGAMCMLQVGVSLAGTKVQASFTNEIPRCDQIQEADSDIIERLEGVETEICDALRFIHSCDVVHHKMKLSPACVSKKYIDLQAYMRMRQEFLSLLKTEMEDKSIIKETFLDRRVGNCCKHGLGEGVLTNIIIRAKSDNTVVP